MGKAVQYYNGLNWQQFGVTEADYITGGIVSDIFTSVKDSNDNLYIICQKTGTAYSYLPIIKISKNGTINKYLTAGKTWAYRVLLESCSPILSRDESKLFFMADTGGGDIQLFSINLINLAAGYNITTEMGLGYHTANPKFAIYQDRYIWVSVGSTVRIYDYDTKAELASVTYRDNYSICAMPNMDRLIMYGVDTAGAIVKYEYNNTSTIATTQLATNVGDAYNYKYMLIDKWGDLIILQKETPKLLKYTTSGTLIQSISLGTTYYNLNTDSQGSYYYLNALATYKIAANTAQGQNFTGTGTKILDSGMTTYGNNITNFNPAVFG
jgi:hypothetical protein